MPVAFGMRPQLARGIGADALDKLDDGDASRWDGHAVEPKFDGMRALVFHDSHGDVHIFSRSGKSQAGKVPHIEDAIKAWLPRDTILDGELAAITEWNMIVGQNVPTVDFNKTMRVMGSSAAKAVAKQASDGLVPISLVVFDIVRYNGEDLMSKTDEYRRDILHSAFVAAEPIYISPRYYDPEEFLDVYNGVVQTRGEGVIIKNLEAPYLPGGRPAKTWIKVKAVSTFDVVVTGFTDANEGLTGKFKGLIGAIEFSAYDNDGELRYVGRCSGMNDAERRAWTEIREKGLFMDGETPNMVIEVRANELVGSGEYRTPRHPQYVGKRIDKTPFECSITQFAVAE